MLNKNELKKGTIFYFTNEPYEIANGTDDIRDCQVYWSKRSGRFVIHFNGMVIADPKTFKSLSRRFKVLQAKWNLTPGQLDDDGVIVPLYDHDPVERHRVCKIKSGEKVEMYDGFETRDEALDRLNYMMQYFNPDKDPLPLLTERYFETRTDLKIGDFVTYSVAVHDDSPITSYGYIAALSEDEMNGELHACLVTVGINYQENGSLFLTKDIRKVTDLKLTDNRQENLWINKMILAYRVGLLESDQGWKGHFIKWKQRELTGGFAVGDMVREKSAHSLIGGIIVGIIVGFIYDKDSGSMTAKIKMGLNDQKTARMNVLGLRITDQYFGQALDYLKNYDPDLDSPDDMDVDWR